MRIVASLALSAFTVTVLSVSSLVSADTASTPDTPPSVTAPTVTPTDTVAPTIDPTSTGTSAPAADTPAMDPSVPLSSAPSSSTGSKKTMTPVVAPAPMTATAPVAVAPSTDTAQYASLECSDPVFAANKCDLCFDGGGLKTGQKVTDLYDNWSNTTTGSVLLYKSQQELPSLVNLGGSGTVITASPADPTAFWQYGSEVLWSDSFARSGDKEFEIAVGKKIQVYTAEVGSSYTLTKSSVKDGDPVMLVKFPITYVGLLPDGGGETESKTHTECIVWRSGTVAAVVPPVAETPVPTEETPIPTPQPQDMTSTKTGPETTVMILLTLLVAGSIVALRRRRA